MMYTLFFAPKSASNAVHVILEEIGVAYELTPSTINMEEAIPPEQRAINPNGWLPVLVWDYKPGNGSSDACNDVRKNGSMYECAAITIYLCDKHPEANLAPAIDDPTRALYLQTLIYFSNSIQKAFQLSYYADRFVNSPTDEPSAQLQGNRRLQETWKVIDDQIGTNEWLLGDNFSAADIYLHMLSTWLKEDRGHPSIDEFSNVKRIADKVMQRPSTQLVFNT